MNKRNIYIYGVWILSLFVTPLAFAAQALTDKPVETAAPPVQKRTEAEEKKLIEKRKRIVDKKTDLNGSSWDISYIASSDPKQKGKKDLLTFQNGQFNSKSLMDRGFTWTNYTISVPNEESELAVWETMQTGKEGIVFIHGEWTKDKMTGNITEQLDGGKKVVEHSFSTTNRVAIPPSTEEAAVSEGASSEPQVQESSDIALVSMEKPIEPVVAEAVKESKKKTAVAAFEPGTTQEKST